MTMRSVTKQMTDYEAACAVMEKQFGHNVVISLATGVNDRVSVRTVNATYQDGSFYVVTHMATHKMKEITGNPNVAICKDLFSAQGIGRSMGNPREEANRTLSKKLREIFFAFYEKHVNENDLSTCILKIALTNAVVFDDSAKYAVDFQNETAMITPFVNDIVY